MALATHTDLEDRLGIDIATGDEGRADRLLQSATDLVLEQAPNTVAEIDAPAIAKILTVEAVARVWVNPEAVSSQTLGSTVVAFGSAGLFLTEYECYQLDRAFRRSRGGAGTIPLG